MNPDQGVVGSQQDPAWPSDQPTEIPNTQAEPTPLEVEALKFKGSKKYPHFAAYLADRRKYYQRHFPGGIPVVEVSKEELGSWWKMAEVIIQELQALEDFIEDTDAAAKQRAVEAAKRAKTE
jgi:hypothetical protein